MLAIKCNFVFFLSLMNFSKIGHALDRIAKFSSKMADLSNPPSKDHLTLLPFSRLRVLIYNVIAVAHVQVHQTILVSLLSHPCVNSTASPTRGIFSRVLDSFTPFSARLTLEHPQT